MSTEKHGFYRPDIDGLRAVAVIAVLLHHAFPRQMPGGFVGVDMFFVISGYLITRILRGDMQAGRFSIGGFYARRVRRIFPALLLVLAVTLGFGWLALLGGEYAVLGKHVAAAGGFVSNLVLWGESGYFDAASNSKPLLHLWSLAIEEQFYLVWPWLLWLAVKWRVPPMPLVLALAAVSLALSIGWRADHAADFYAPMTRAWSLLAGAALVLLPPLPRGRAAVSWAGLALLVAAMACIKPAFAYPSFWALLPVLGTAMLIAAGSEAAPGRWLGTKPMVAIGLISYPLYLWHWPLLSYARIIFSLEPPAWVRAILLLLAVLLAWGTYRWAERPLRFGAKRAQHTVALLAGLVAVAAFGGAVWQSDGVPMRPAARDYVDNSQELIRTPSVDDACLRYLGVETSPVTYCRYTDAGGVQTVAVVGDSHAHTAYPGIAAVMAARGINTVLLANTSCVSFVDVTTGDTEADHARCAKATRALLAALTAHADITRVYDFTRGPVYMLPNAKTQAPPQTSAQAFRRGLQATVDYLRHAGKRVYYVLENPEYGVRPDACVPRPLRREGLHCARPLTDVLARQADYRALVARIHGLSVLDPVPAFCPDGQCRMTIDGMMLYADDNHLSRAGSMWQAQRLLVPGVNQ